MKESGTMHWLETDSTVDNASRFTGRGAGFRGNPSSFRHLNSLGTFWSTTPFGSSNSFARGYDFYLSSSNQAFATSVAVANVGQSIRCIKDIANSLEKPIYNQIRIYPNPARDQLNISLEKNENYQLAIYNTLGQSLLLQTFSDHVLHLDIAFLPAGSYSIHLISKDQQFIQHLIKTQ